MSRISMESAAALVENRKYHNSNTLVSNGQMRLHGNLIAEINGNTITLDICGWNSVTTRARLNAIGRILSFSVSVTRGVLWLYVHGKAYQWDGFRMKFKVKI